MGSGPRLANSFYLSAAEDFAFLRLTEVTNI